MAHTAFNLTWKKYSGLKEKDLRRYKKRLFSYRKRLESICGRVDYKDDESSIQLPFDEDQAKGVMKVANMLNRKPLEDVVVIGIGGSNLGAKALYEALRHKKKLTRMHFLDTVSESNMEDVVAQLVRHKSSKKFAICLISKSGTTTESLVNASVLEQRLCKHFKDVAKRFVVICDIESPLYTRATEEGMYTLTIPGPVGGRYSVFSAVGLLPLFLAGVNLQELLHGARIAVKDCTVDKSSNPALITAAVMYEAHSNRGINIHNTFVFNPELESMGKWYRQLMGESIGKRDDVKGREVRAGITPITAVGSTDMHSMVQMFYGGPRDKMTNFVFVSPTRSAKIPANSLFSGIVKGIGGKTFGMVLDAIRTGNESAYAKNKQSNVSIELPSISESSLGYYLQFRMIEMMYLAKLMGLNAFNQPSVEDYKRVTRKLLR